MQGVKKVRKLLAAVLTITMLLGSSIVFAEESGTSANPAIQAPVRNVLSTTGVIKEISQDKVRVKGQGDNAEIVLTIQSSTYVLNAADGTPVAVKDLKQGDAVTAYYGPWLTESLPPQGSAIALLVGTPQKGSAGMYMQVAHLQKNTDGSIKVLCTNADRLVTISPAVFAGMNGIKEGSELIVWYDMMTMSLPAQAAATKVLLLPAKADIRVHTLAGVIVVKGKELALSNGDTIQNSDNTVMLPLRTIAESLGYKVIWHEENKTVELQNGPNTMLVTIGSKIYGKLKMAVPLNHAPELVNGKTLVPVEFFTELMGLKVEINNSHI